ncbi:hypothetical protein GS458_2710 [Geobacillus stearothermophilus]|nr:hypothetical protein GS458_2710 [Geobacillus stearothermophilus]
MMFQLVNQVIEVKNSDRGVSAIEIEFVMENCQSGQINVTDIMLQSGSIATLWKGHPSETRWSLDG